MCHFGHGSFSEFFRSGAHHGSRRQLECTSMAVRVLLADKSTYTRWTLRDLLLGYGYSVVGEARSGREAMEKFDELRPDLLVMDLSLNEPEVVAAVRELKIKYPELRVLISCGMGQRRGAMEALAAGATDFIIRPYSERQVLQTVKKTL